MGGHWRAIEAAAAHAAESASAPRRSSAQALCGAAVRSCSGALDVLWLGCVLTPLCTCRAQNRRNTPERLELKKYNPHLQRYTIHREVK